MCRRCFRIRSRCAIIGATGHRRADANRARPRASTVTVERSSPRAAATSRIELAQLVDRGVDQYVVLGAGLDTFAYRNPYPQLRVFEIDHPATQAWKREHLTSAGIAGTGVDGVRADRLRTRPPGRCACARRIRQRPSGILRLARRGRVSATGCGVRDAAVHRVVRAGHDDRLRLFDAARSTAAAPASAIRRDRRTSGRCRRTVADVLRTARS